MERKNAPEVLMRLTSTQPAFAPHWLISFCQNWKPEASGKRERKSTYCSWTKKSESSIVMGWFVPGRRRSGLTFVLPYINSEGRRLPVSETVRSLGAWLLCARAAPHAKGRADVPADKLRTLLVQI